MNPKIRFKAKQVGDVWRVYDSHRASYPYVGSGFGRVKQDVETEVEAQAEADRLEGLT